MRSHANPVLFRESDGVFHNARVSPMKPTRHVSGRNMAHHVVIVSHPLRTETLTHVTINIDG